MKIKLIIDIGTKYLTMTVVAFLPNETLPVVLEVSIKDVENKNNNILGRTITREYAKLATNHPINEVIVLPRRNAVVHQTINLEYHVKPEVMKKKLLEQVNIPGLPGEYITDWAIHDDNPEQDYQKVFVSSISVTEFKFISETMKSLGVRDYRINCPSNGLIRLDVNKDVPIIVMQIGHKSSELFVVKNEVIELYRSSRTFTGTTLSNVIMSDTPLQQEELVEVKNNAKYSDLESHNAISEILDFLTDDVKKLVDTYATIDITPICGFVVVGGIANLDFEVLTELADIHTPRVYSRLPALNHLQIPNTVRAYIYDSVHASMYTENDINFTAPKDKSIGQYIKMVSTFYTETKTALYMLLLLVVLNSGATYLQNYLAKEKLHDIDVQISNYQGEVDGLKSTVESLERAYAELLDDKELKIVNYGKLLSTFSDLTPQGMFITNMSDITHKYIVDTGNALDDTPTDTGGTVNGLELSTVDMLVAIEVSGYTLQRVKAFDYALLLKSHYRDAVVTEILNDDNIHKFTIHVIIDK